ncbi:LuxR C-terminal-related transcriptional regulator [Prosthecobacter sp.]|uniref:helix-turn-helix transcriptional regulator n=1 Tax=Prosthecobacter sp. TaxID=1965333 RepID=UPI0037834A43
MADLPVSLSRLLDVLHRLHAVKDVADFPMHVMGVIRELLPATCVSFDQIDLATGEALNVIDGAIPFTREEFMRRWQAHCHEHPGIAYLSAGGDSTVFTISDFLTRRQFERTGLYQEVVRHFGVRDQLGIILPVPGHILGIAVNRDTGFTSEEKKLMQMLQPHFVRAFENAQLFTSLRGASEMDFRSWRKHGLTQRECEVLRWVVEGKRNGEIATILGTKPGTIAKHMENLFAKLRVETRSAAAAQARLLLDPATILPNPGQPASDAGGSPA